MKVLRIQLYQPSAHFRIPFTYQRRHTYPIPPYSTVIGFLINMLGLIKQSEEDFQQLKKIKLSVSGYFETKTTEYIWFRNLSKDAHKDKFGSTTNREINGHVEHPGGQSPISIDVLDNMYLTIHLGHENENFLHKIKSVLENPINRLEIMHLGRAEDWLVYIDISLTELTVSQLDKNYHRFFWIPERAKSINKNNSDALYQNTEGLSYRLPTFATIEGYEETFNRNAKRSFEYITTKLNNGIIKNIEYLYDKETDLPVFLAELN